MAVRPVPLLHNGVVPVDLTHWPFVGRDDDVAEIAGWYDDPRCGGVILTGPAGVGKTGVAIAIVNHLRTTGKRYVVRIVATESLRTIPFGALAHLLPSGVLQDGGQVDPTAIFDGIRSVAESVGRGRMVVLVDDLPYLDEGTQSVASQLHAANLGFVVATARSDVPLQPGQLSLERSFGVRRVTIEPLDRGTVAEVVTAALGAPMDSESFEQVWELTQGNPLYIRELLLSAAQRDALRMSTGGTWQLTDTAAGRSRIADVIGSRLEGIEQAQTAVLQLLAVAGPMPLSDLEREGVLDEVEALERVDLVTLGVDTKDPEVRIAHPLQTEVILGQLGVLARRRVLQRAIDIVQRRRQPRIDDAVLLAGWQLDMGQTPDLTTLLDGTRLAHSALDYTSTIRLARAALEATGSVEMRRMLVEALMMTGDSKGAEEVAAVEIEAGSTDEPERMKLLAARLYNLLWFLEDHAKARAVVEAERARFTGRDMQELLVLRTATLLSFEDDTLGALAELERHGDWSPSVAAQALTGMSQLRLTVGRAGAALEAAVAAIEASGPDPSAISPTTYLAHGWALVAGGRLTEAIDAVAAGRRATHRAGAMPRAALALGHGEMLALHGRLGQARQALADAILLAESVNNHVLRTMALGALASVIGQLREVNAAAGLLADVEDDILPYRVGSDERAKGMAWAMSTLGRPAEARDVLRNAGDACQKAGEQWDALRLWVESARLGDAREVAERSAEAGAQIDGPVAAMFVALISALATGDAGELSAVAQRLDDHGFELLAAEAWAEAATDFRRNGEPRSASAAASRAETLAARCEGARTVALLSMARSAPVVPLSAREREIARLAADGLTNQEIAERLVVSVRTVGNHLQNVYVKLGVNRRSDLRAVLDT